MSGSFDWQASFAGGILGPSLHGRVDLAKYAVGLKEGKNIFIHAHGGASNRAGTVHVAQLGPERIRLVPFERDELTSYVLGMSGNLARVFRNGAPVMSGGTPYSFVTPFNAAQTSALAYVQSVDVMYTAERSVSPRKIMHYGATDWRLETVNFNPDTPTPAAPTATPFTTGDGKVYRYRVSAVVGGVEGFASPEGATVNAKDLVKEGSYNTITWPALATAPEQYRIYRLRGGIWGYIGFTEGAVTTMVDDNIGAETDVTIRERQDFFQGAGNYPSSVTLTQQRLIFAGTDNEPDLVVGSIVGDYENFTKAYVTKADDRFRVSISGEKLNRVNGLVGLQELLVLTGSGEYGVGAAQGYLSATEPRQVRYGSSGSSGMRPLLVAESVIYVDRSGRNIRDLVYSLERDGYSGSDLTMFIPHLLSGRRVVDWAHAHTPNGLIWVVLDNGAVLCLTYKREQEVWAWSEHDFGGAVESICSIWEGNEDRVYMAVRRGGSVFIERMASREIIDSPHDSCFVDCATIYSGAATNEITGLDRFNGQTIKVVADGDVYDDMLVTGGKVVLPHEFTQAYAGLPYYSELETLPLYVELQGVGAARGLPTKAEKVFIQVEKTRGVEVYAGDAEQPSDMVQTIDPLDARLPLFTGLWDFDLFPSWSDMPTIKVVQRHPLPMTILGISPKWSIGRG